VEQASARPAAPALKPRVDETTSSGLPPLPTPPKPAGSDASTTHVPDVQSARAVAPPPPSRQPSRTTAQTEILPSAHARTAVARKNIVEPAHVEDSSFEYGQRLGGDVAAAPNSKTPVRYRVETGARIRASLDGNLDSRTVSAGPAGVRLRRAYISEGRVVFPAGTMAYGEARANGSRFTVRFTRLVLPDKTEVSFEGLAYDLQDRKPGLAPSRRIAGAQQQDGTGAKVGRAVANTMLTAVNGGLAQDAARNAAETALNSRDPTAAPRDEALLGGTSDRPQFCFDPLVIHVRFCRNRQSCKGVVQQGALRCGLQCWSSSFSWPPLAAARGSLRTWIQVTAERRRAA
jgi:hypothetical protein